MNKFIIFFTCILFITGCSLNKNSKFWSASKNIIEENKPNFKKIFFDEETLEKELNADVPINLGKILNKDKTTKNYFNNDGRLNYNGELKKSSKYKFSKIKNFYKFEPKISFNNKNIIFFDNKGSILKFDEKSELIWKFQV